MNALNRLILESPQRLGFPICTYPGMALTGATVRDLVTSAAAQIDTQEALHHRYRTAALLSAMDLSAEAEAFGCAVAMSDAEIPTVTGRLVTNRGDAEALSVPEPGEARTRVYLDAVRGLRARHPHALVLGGCIGPFSLAARLAGVSEALELTAAEPDLMHLLVEKSARFLQRYVQAFKNAGADGILMAEPAAGLLSPRGMTAFSSNYIRQIAQGAADDAFALVLHNCAARLVHLAAVLDTGLRTFHFGAPMELAAALAKVPAETVLLGNLDPAGVFVSLPPTEVTARARQLLQDVAAFPNFALSSGCDVPPNASLAAMDAFFAALA